MTRISIIFAFTLSVLAHSTKAHAYNCQDVFASVLDGTKESTGPAKQYFLKYQDDIMRVAELAAEFMVTGIVPPDLNFMDQLDKVRDTFSEDVGRDREEQFGDLPDVAESGRKSMDASDRLVDAIEDEDVEAFEDTVLDFTDAIHGMTMRQYIEFHPNGWSEFIDFFEPFVLRLTSLKWAEKNPPRRTPELLRKVYGERGDYELAFTPILNAEDPFADQFLYDLESHQAEFGSIAIIVGLNSLSRLYEGDEISTGYHSDYQYQLTEVLMGPGLEVLGTPVSGSNGYIRWFGVRPALISAQLEQFMSSWASQHHFPYGLHFDYDHPDVAPLHIHVDSRFVYLDESERKKFFLTGESARLSELLQTAQNAPFVIANLLSEFAHNHPLSDFTLQGMTVVPGAHSGTIHLKKGRLDVKVTLGPKPVF